MFSLIPAEYYNVIWHHLLMVATFYVLVQAGNCTIDDNRNVRTKNILGTMLFLFTLFFFGFRPLSGKYFADMRTYSYIFIRYQEGEPIRVDKDIVFEFVTKVCAEIMTIDFYFFFCFLLYLYPMYRISKKFFGIYWFYAFFMLIASYSFWSYGVNGIRNGIATSIFLLALSVNKKYIAYAMIIFSFFLHKSMIIPLAAYFMSEFFKNTKSYILFWIATIPLSLVLGTFLEAFFLGLGFGEDDRFQAYLGEDTVSAIGSFRWDFILYSATGVFAGWFFIYKKNFVDPVYNQLVNIYLFANGFWVLVIRANFSNRFAYLSWFMLALIIIYPLLKVRFYNNQHIVVVRILAVYFLFTYFMNYILISIG